MRRDRTASGPELKYMLFVALELWYPQKRLEKLVYFEILVFRRNPSISLVIQLFFDEIPFSSLLPPGRPPWTAGAEAEVPQRGPKGTPSGPLWDPFGVNVRKEIKNRFKKLAS